MHAPNIDELADRLVSLETSTQLASVGNLFVFIAGPSADVSSIAGLTGTSKCYGGVLSPFGKIFGMPSSSESVFIIDPVTKIADTSCITGLTGTAKWYGLLLWQDFWHSSQLGVHVTTRLRRGRWRRDSFMAAMDAVRFCEQILRRGFSPSIWSLFCFFSCARRFHLHSLSAYFLGFITACLFGLWRLHIQFF